MAPVATAAVTDQPPAAVAEELDRLRASLDASGIPSKQVDRNLLIGTWNIRAFGDLTEKWEADADDTPKRDLRSLRCITEIVSRFDVVAVQEVKGNIKALRHMLKALGPDWAFILTDVTKGRPGNDERLAFLFDTRRVKPSGLACELVVPEERLGKKIKKTTLERQFARTPYAVSFVSAGRTFILVTLHVLWGKDEEDRTPELEGIAEWMGDWAESVAEWNQNLIVLGDFNIAKREGDPNFEAFTSTGLHVPAELDDVLRTISDEPGSGSFYDQIAWFEDRLTLTYAGRAGGYDFKDVVLTEFDGQAQSWRMSDHFPLWAEFQVRERVAKAGRFSRPG